MGIEIRSPYFLDESAVSSRQMGNKWNSLSFHGLRTFKAGVMDQQLRVYTALIEDPSWTPSTYIRQITTTVTTVLDNLAPSFGLSRHTNRHKHRHRYTQLKIKIIFN